MKLNKIYLTFCIAAIALFFVGRCTAPKPIQSNDKHTIDSLNRRIAQSHQLAIIYKQNAQKAFQKGLDSQKAKVVVRTIYIKQIAKNHAMPATKKDSVIKEMFHVEYSDSSKFTTHVANGILDLNTDNKALKADAKLDSVSIAAKDEGIIELGQALNSITEEGGSKDGLIIEERNATNAAKKEVNKQKFLKWVAIITTFVVTTIAISK